MTKQIALIDHCLPDFFSGYHKTTINIPVYGTMTRAELADEIESEMNMLYELLESDHDKKELELWDKFIEELRSEGDKVYVSISEEERKELENDELMEPACLFFGVINPVHKGHITFLNP